jgi:hypothetical protein
MRFLSQDGAATAKFVRFQDTGMPYLLLELDAQPFPFFPKTLLFDRFSRLLLHLFRLYRS